MKEKNYTERGRSEIFLLRRVLVCVCVFERARVVTCRMCVYLASNLLKRFLRGSLIMVTVAVVAWPRHQEVHSSGRAPDYFTYLVTRIHLKIRYNVALTPETVVSGGV